MFNQINDKSKPTGALYAELSEFYDRVFLSISVFEGNVRKISRKERICRKNTSNIMKKYRKLCTCKYTHSFSS